MTQTASLVGYRFRDFTNEQVLDMLQNQSETKYLKVVADPDNQYDKQAIKVLLHNEDDTETHIGFITKDHTYRIKKLLDKRVKLSLNQQFTQSTSIDFELVE